MYMYIYNIPIGEMMAHRVGVEPSKQEPISKEHPKESKEHSTEHFEINYKELSKEHSEEHAAPSSSSYSHKDIHGPGSHKITDNAQNPCVNDGRNVCGEVSDYEVSETRHLYVHMYIYIIYIYICAYTYTYTYIYIPRSMRRFA
jgi:hypothetical protein